ncbi:DRTGG domain-containing protein [Caloranaerobacter ferrireducens]|uniref:DRTGG domain-containing protein n=1 Tax=Caloranaerobacter ferrireducens TaxID=1323370 RepID=UPI00084D35AA|nr:DRTGG domain-containing protein [Caloranaerobacter ferrireducens]
MTKHEKIIKYIEELEVGSKISVRSIAQQLNVSEGTAYRAIKDAESRELVKTMPRVGTVRIKKVEKGNIEKLSFAEVVNIVEGSILGGHEGIHKMLNKFIIGAMTIKEMEKYLQPGSLVIVGDREEVYEEALNKGCAILITGGFGCSERIKEKANMKKLPVITTAYDTFTIATIINKAIYERKIKKDILLVENIMDKNPPYMFEDQNIGEWKQNVITRKLSSFTIVDKDMNVVGVVTPKDVTGIEDKVLLKEVMTKEPITLPRTTSVAYVSHIMTWENIEIIPIVKGRKLIGVVNRQDVIRALRYMKSQPHIGETVEDMIIDNFSLEIMSNGLRFKGEVMPLMLNQLGAASCGTMAMVMAAAGSITLKEKKHYDVFTDSFMVYFIKPLQVDNKIEIVTDIIDMGRNFCKVDIEILHNKGVVAKAMMSAKILKK